MKMLFLPRFGQQGASSRMRSYQYQPLFEAAGIECSVSPLFADGMLLNKYKDGGYSLFALLSAYWQRCRALTGARQFSLVWIEKEALPWWPTWFEKWMLRDVPYVLDFDDAIFHNYDLHPSPWIRRFYGRRIDRLMAGARLVVAGNRYLADRAKAAGAARVEVIPTVVDLARYLPKTDFSNAGVPRIVWIGSPSTAQYLLELAEPLRALAQRVPFVLRVIGADALAMPGVDIEFKPWTSGTEAALIEECAIGIMPLRDSPWEQGKCAYKLIQYMACGLPTVSSPIGANLAVVVNGATGLFAETPDAWAGQLEALLRDDALRKRLGEAGRVRVEAEFCLQQTAPRMLQLLKEAGGS